MHHFPTPKSLKILLLATIGLSLLSPYLAPWLGLSLLGIKNFYIWQLASYPFVEIAPQGISFPFLLHLAFNVFLLWSCGASLIDRIGTRPFFYLYFSSVVVGGLFALSAMALFQLPYFYLGSTAPLYAVFTAWVLLNYGAEIYLFFALPFKAHWLLLGVFGANFLIDLLHRDWIYLFGYTATLLYSYIFSILAFRIRSPFSFLHSFERNLLRLQERMRHIGKKTAPYQPTKVYDIRSGDLILNDDQFMDAMLAKISLYGEATLTSEEKNRMRQISERKKKK